jgi:hypothetical protein
MTLIYTKPVIKLLGDNIMKKNATYILKAAVVLAITLAMTMPASAVFSNTNTITRKEYMNTSEPASREIVMQDSFETYEDFLVDDFPPWTTFDGDGSPTWGMSGYTWLNVGYTGSFMIFNPTQTEPPLSSGYDAHTGTKYISCWDSITPPNDDWLFTPLLEADTFEQVSLWARSLNDLYGLEDFEIGVSTTDTEPTSFVILQTYMDVPVTWTEYTVDISSYTGESIYIGIHVFSYDVFAFFMDDFEVTGTGVPDNTPPTTTCTLDGTLEGDVYTSEVTVTLTAIDTQSGVNYTMYKLDDGDWIVYTAPFVVSEEGAHELLFYSVDKAGNEETEKSKTFTIEYPIAVEITVTGGIGLSATIKNVGTEDLTDIDWSFRLDGALIFIGKTKSGTISTLAAGESVTVKDFVIGLGKTGIIVTAGSEEATVEGTVLLFLVIGVA